MVLAGPRNITASLCTLKGPTNKHSEKRGWLKFDCATLNLPCGCVSKQSPRKGEFALHTHFRATKCSSYYDTTPAPRHCPNFGTSYTPSRVLEHQCQIEKAGKNPQTSTRSSDRTKDAIPPTATIEVHKADKVQGSRLSQGSTGTHSHARAWHYEMLVIVKLSGSIGAVSSARSQ